MSTVFRDSAGVEPRAAADDDVMDIDTADAVAQEPETAPRHALRTALQTRLTEELLSALGTARGSVRPRYRRGAPPADRG